MLQLFQIAAHGIRLLPRDGQDVDVARVAVVRHAALNANDQRSLGLAGVVAIAGQPLLATLERQDRAGIEVPIREAARVREEFAAVVELVRELPGFNSFLRQQKFADAASAIPARGALAYVLTTPNGSLVLLVSHEETGLNVTAIHAPLVTAGDLVRLFIQPDAKNETLAGYMAVHRDESRLSEAISAFSPNIGEQLLAPLHQVLQRARVTDLCLVPIGLIGLLPLHAISWQQQRTRRCLLDDLTIRYAPSAAFQSIARIRATRPAGSGRAVIVGNPLPQSIPLDGAEFEARAVAAVVPADAVNLFVVEDATKSQVIHALPHAEYVHLACHGSASVFGPVLGGALYLANDEPLLAHEILEIDNFGPRLAVLSACETGVLQGYESADEVLSIGSMFLAAGAAGVVATLWSVDDLATALLMCKFYETLASENTGPADALRKAQLWLRGLTAEEEAEYICTRPLLRAQRATRGRSTRASSRPYTSVTKWGAFVFTGA